MKKWVFSIRYRSPAALDGLAVLLFIALGFLPFVPEILLGRRLLDGDIYRQSIPVLQWYRQAIDSGQSTQWTTGILGGFPITFSQYSLTSPLDWLAARYLDPDRAFAVMLALHLPLAGIATYFYARTIGTSRASSILAGVGYQLSTEALALGINGYLLRTLFLLPTLLLSTELIVARGVRGAVLAASAVGLAMLSGTAYIAAIALLNAGIYVLVRALLLSRRDRALGLRVLVSMGLAVLVGMGLAAARVLPTMAVTAESVRSDGLSLGISSGQAPDLGFLLAGYLLPLTRLFEFGGADRPSYVGPIVLALAGAALLGGWRKPVVALLGVLLVFDLLASLGENGPIFSLVHQLPPFAYFRHPSRFSSGSAFFLSMLAAQALDYPKLPWVGRKSTRQGSMMIALMATFLFILVVLAGFIWNYGGVYGGFIRDFVEAHKLGPLHPLRPRVLIALTALLTTAWVLCLGLGGRLSRVGLQLSAIGITLAILLPMGFLMIPVYSPSPPPPTARFLQEDHSLFRVLSLNSGQAFYDYLLYFAGNDPKRVNPYGPAEVDFERRYQEAVLGPNISLQYGLDSVDGYEVLKAKRQGIALAYMGSDSVELENFDNMHDYGYDNLGAKLRDVKSRRDFDSLAEYLPVLKAFNVKYVITNRELRDSSDLLAPVFATELPMLDPRTKTVVRIYEVKGVLPRAYLVPNSITVKSPLEALDAIRSRATDPSATVALEQQADPPLPAPRLDKASSAVDRLTYAGDEIRIDVHTTGSGYLVLNDSYYPGWSATVDGMPTPISVADGWVRAIPIQTAGTHSITLAYVPPLSVEGRWVTLLSLLICLGAVLMPALWRA